MRSTTHPTPTEFVPQTKVGRFGPIMLVGQFGWATLGAAAGTLLAALAADVRPEHKVDFLALITSTGAVASVLCIIIAGALSDRTRTRIGPRNPWIIGGALVGTLGFIGIGLTHNPALIVLSHVVYQGGLNCMLGAFNALPADYIDDTILGKVSAFGGAGYLLAQIVGAVIGGALVTHPSFGFVAIGGLLVVSAVIVVLLTPPHPAVGKARLPRLTGRELLARFAPPRDREFWWILIGRFLFILGLFATMQFQLYIATDVMGMTTKAAGALIALNAVVLALSAAVCTVIAGPWSDRIGRRKPFVGWAPVLVAVGVAPLLFVHQPWALTVFMLLAGIAFGTYISVDGALMIEVLPDRADSARDLGFRNAANALPIVLAPGVAAVLVKVAGYDAVFVFSMLAAIAGGLCIFRVRRVR